MKCLSKLLLGMLAIAFCGSLLAMPQSTPPSPQDAQDPRARIRATVSLVIVPVSVKDSSGGLVTDLVQNDFRIFEDAIEQKMALFSTDAFPLSAAVLLDDDLKRTSAEKVQKTLQAIGAGFSASDEVSLWRFDNVPESVFDFTGDNDALVTQLKRVDINSSIAGAGSAPMTSGPRVNTQPLPGPLQSGVPSVGHANNKHINDALYAAGEQLQGRPRERRKIIFIISDGQNAKNNTHSYDETLKLLLSADVSVYAIGVGEANLNRGLNVLSKYAHATGGDIFYGSSRDDFERLYSRTAEQARNQYTLGYVPANTDRTKPYHNIEVRVRRPGLTLLSRDGYYIAKP